jgi:excisionase family DNA binding protein
MEKLNDYLRVAEASQLLGVSQTTLRKYAETGKIPVRKHPGNGYRLFKRSDLEDFLNLASLEAGPSLGRRQEKAR